MKRPSDTEPGPPTLADTDSTTTRVDPEPPAFERGDADTIDSGLTDPGGPAIDEVDEMLAGFAGRASVYKKRTADSRGLSGAVYDATAKPAKRHDTGEIPAPVILNITEELPIPPRPIAPAPVVDRPRVSERPRAAPTEPVTPRSAQKAQPTTVPGRRQKKRNAVTALAAAAVGIVIALGAGGFALHRRTEPTAASTSTTAVAVATTVAPVKSAVTAAPSAQPEPPVTARATTATATASIGRAPQVANSSARVRPARSAEPAPAVPSATASTPRSDIKWKFLE